MAKTLSGYVDNGRGAPLPNISAIVTRVTDGGIVTSGLTNADGEWLFTGLPESEEYFVNLADGAGNAIVRGPWAGEIRSAWVRDRLALPDTGLAVLPNGGNTTVGGLPLVLDPNPINVLEWTATGIFSAGAVGLTEEAADLRYVNLDGDTMTGDLTINASLSLDSSGSSLYVAGSSTFEGDVVMDRGLYVALGIDASGPVVVHDTLSVASKPVIVSPTAGNTLTWDATGLYSAGGMTQAAADLRYEPLDTMYTKTESDARYPQKTDVDPYPTYLTAAEADALFLTPTEANALYEPFDSAYTKAESDARYTQGGITQAAADLRYEPLDSAYTKSEDDARFVNLAGGSVMTGLLGPTSNNTRDLGTTALRWRALYGMTGDFTTSLTVATKPVVISPDAANIVEWRANGFYAAAGAVSDIWVNTTGDTMTGDLNMTANVLPTVTNTRDLGSTSLRFRKVWSVDGEFTNAPTVGGAALLTAAAADALFLTPAEGNAAYVSLHGSTMDGELWFSMGQPTIAMWEGDAPLNNKSLKIYMPSNDGRLRIAAQRDDGVEGANALEIRRSGNLITTLTPSVTNTLDLGTTALRWRKLYAVDADLTGAVTFTTAPTVGGSSLLTATAGDTAFVNVGGDTMTGALTVTTSLTVQGNAGVGAYLQRSSTDNVGPAFTARKTRGALGSATIVAADDQIGIWYGEAWDGGALRAASAIEFAVDGTPGSGDMPGRISLYTATDGGVTLTERLRVTNAGLVGIGGRANATAGAQLDIQATAAGTTALSVRPHASTANTLANLWVWNAAGTAIVLGATNLGWVSDVISATAIGSYATKRIPVYNSGGTLQGYLPLYT